MQRTYTMVQNQQVGKTATRQFEDLVQLAVVLVVDLPVPLPQPEPEVHVCVRVANHEHVQQLARVDRGLVGGAHPREQAHRVHT